jgi:hypothetical protein
MAKKHPLIKKKYWTGGSNTIVAPKGCLHTQEYDVYVLI